MSALGRTLAPAFGVSRRAAVGSVLLAASACANHATSKATSSSVEFPADYADSFTEVRGCRKSGDHDLDFIRVLVDPSALGPYTDRTTPFPDGAIALKEQYDVSDASCSGPIVQWTVMKKDTAATDRLGWDWQRVSTDRKVVEENTARCYGCHAACSGPPNAGYDSTCTDP
ncbi:MAG TPA: cytochrome P460 family protein [Polyangiaceae bacterium]|nr:cytochrome P460 family protein [Polyangiaceae bacterium]